MTPLLRRVLAAAVALLGVILLRRRPVRGPERDGSWHPID